MIRLSQGNVFEAIGTSHSELTLVFGHIGYNKMRQCWEAFSTRYSQLARVRDPFIELANDPVQLPDGQWLWFVPEEKNHGMTDQSLTTTLDTVLSWAAKRHIKSVATNGIANTNHSHNTAHNRQSDDERTCFIITYATAAEQKYGIVIELISLNDVFVRTH